MDYIVGIIGTILSIFISCAIWKVLYGYKSSVDGISYEMVVMNFIIGMGLTSAYNINDQNIQKKLKDGSIAMEFLKPVSYKSILLAENLGNIFFKLLTSFLPAALIGCVFIAFIAPVSILSLFLFVLSIVLGFVVFWLISMIVQLSAFWIMNVWSISTIKNVLVSLLSGSLIPIWFMPKILQSIISYTPFESIYSIPVWIYLGQIEGLDILISFAKQGGRHTDSRSYILVLSISLFLCG